MHSSTKQFPGYLMLMVWMVMVGLLFQFFSSSHSEESGSANQTQSARPKPATTTKRQEASTGLPIQTSQPGSDKNLSQDEDQCWQEITERFPPNENYASDIKEKLNTVIGDWYYSADAADHSPPSETSTSGKFLLGLAKAGLLSGRQVAEDLETARELLQQVHDEDPENSAPLIYLASIEKEAGNGEKADEYMQAANNTTHFDSYIKNVTKVLFENINSPSDFLGAQEFWSTAPVPDYSALKKMLIERNDSQIAQQLMADGLNEQSGVLDIKWVPIEYQIGKTVAEQLGDKTAYPSYQELLKNKLSAMAPAYFSASKNGPVCDPSIVENQVTLVKQALQTR